MAGLVYKEGSRGAIVKQIQKAVGCYPDGIWGRLTTEAVKAFQREHHLTPDGIAGPKTLAVMGIEAVMTGAETTSSSVSAITAYYAGKTITLRKSRRRIDYLVVHCTASPEGQDQTVEQIRRDHLKRGFSDIGYHYIVYRDGTVWAGRSVDIAGAHVSGHNPYSIGISYVGGLENDPRKNYKDLKAKDTRTEAQKASLLALLMDLRKLYPKAKIQGHRDFSPDLNHNGTIEPNEWIKDCPSYDAKMAYRNI